MNGELRSISLTEMKGYLDDIDIPEAHRSIFISWAADSVPLLVGTYDSKLLCLVGLIPPTFLSDTAYIWCYDTAEVRNHSILFGRHARRLLTSLRRAYPRILGHCNNPRSIAWLTSLGATFIGTQGTASTFEIT